MIRNHFNVVLLVAVILLTIPGVAEAAPAAARQWNVDKTNQISYETDYALFNNGSQLGYENRTFGVDLGRGIHNGGFFAFLRQAPPGKRDRRLGPIAGDDNVAIFNTKTLRYLVFYSRGDTKAELEWTSSPVYEWQLQDQSTSGGRVHFALFNSRVKKYLVYKVQNYGINLGWLAETPPTPQATSVGLSAQPIVNGWVPYAGKFGGNTRGNLLAVQNASQTATLLFIKPGKSTGDCSDPNATLRISPKGVLTPQQMTILYGSATPRLPINFLACLTTPRPQMISLTFLNINYKLDN